MEELAADLCDTRPGHIDQNFSAAFQQIARFAFQVRFEKGQRVASALILLNPTSGLNARTSATIKSALVVRALRERANTSTF